MKYFIGWMTFLLIVIFLGVGGFFLVKNLDVSAFEFKDINEVTYQDYDINDFVRQNIKCSNNKCTYKKKELTYAFSEVTKLGKQNLTLTINYDNKEYQKTFNIQVVDKEEPKIILKEKVIFLKLNTKFKPEDYILEVTDNYDTLDINNIEIQNPVLTNKEGSYEVIYKIKDSSDNAGLSKLKVKVGSNEVEPTNEASLLENDFEWEFKTSGILNLNHTLNKNKKEITTTKDITLGWDTNLKITSLFMGSTKYKITLIINDKKIKDPTNLDSDLYLKVINKDYDKVSDSFTYEFNEGTYYLYMKVEDTVNNISLIENLTLNLKYPEKLTEIRLVSTQIEDYELVCVEGLGGKEEFDSVSLELTSSDDDRFKTDKDTLVASLDEYPGCLVLDAKKGYSYNFTGKAQEDGKTFTKDYTFRK